MICSIYAKTGLLTFWSVFTHKEKVCFERFDPRFYKVLLKVN